MAFENETDGPSMLKFVFAKNKKTTRTRKSTFQKFENELKFKFKFVRNAWQVVRNRIANSLGLKWPYGIDADREIAHFQVIRKYCRMGNRLKKKMQRIEADCSAHHIQSEHFWIPITDQHVNSTQLMVMVTKSERN